jgi:anthranilate phosphoribosyltransferase
VAITLPPDGVLRCIEEAHIGFFFAPAYHPAMRHAAPVRKQLGVRTVFNLIGPLANPARVRHQTVGVGDVDAARKVASVLQRLGHAHAFVVCGPDGLDELGLSDDSICLEVTPSGVREYHVDLTALGLRRASVEQLRGGTADDNARIIRDVLAGEQGAARDVVVLNAAAALVAADEAANMCEGAQRAEYSIDSGAARDALDALIAVSNRVA